MLVTLHGRFTSSIEQDLIGLVTLNIISSVVILKTYPVYRGDYQHSPCDAPSFVNLL